MDERLVLAFSLGFASGLKKTAASLERMQGQLHGQVTVDDIVGAGSGRAIQYSVEGCDSEPSGLHVSDALLENIDGIRSSSNSGSMTRTLTSKRKSARIRTLARSIRLALEALDNGDLQQAEHLLVTALDHAERPIVTQVLTLERE